VVTNCDLQRQACLHFALFILQLSGFARLISLFWMALFSEFLWKNVALLNFSKKGIRTSLKKCKMA